MSEDHPPWRFLRARSIIGKGAQIIFVVVIMRCPPLDSRICRCQPGKEPGNARALPRFTDAFVTLLRSLSMLISFRKKTMGSAHKIKTAFRPAATPSVHRSGIWAFFRAWCVAVSQFPASVAQDAWRKTDRSLSVRRARFVLDFSRPRVPRPFSIFFCHNVGMFLMFADSYSHRWRQSFRTRGCARVRLACRQ